MALTSVNHPGGPAGLAAAIAANAFPSEEVGAPPAPRGGESPARRASSASLSTPPRSEGRRRSVSGKELMGPGPSPLRPRFITPGRLRRSAFVRKGRSASMSAGTALGLISSSPDRRRAKSSATRPHRLPLSAAALEAASLAVGLATALGYAPPPVATESDRGITVRAVYRAAELLYSRHALGLRWSKGALVVTKTAAAANAAEMSTAAAAAAVAVAARRRSKGKSKGKRKKGGGAAAKVANGAASAKWDWGGANGMGSAAPSPRGSDKAADAAARAAAASDNAPRPSPRRLNPNGELEDVEAPGEATSDQGMMTIEIPLPSPSEGEEEEMEAALLTTAGASKGRLEIRAVASPRVRPSAAQAAPRMVPPSPRPVPPGKAWPKLPAAAAAQEVADGTGDGRASKGGGEERRITRAIRRRRRERTARRWRGLGGAGMRVRVTRRSAGRRRYRRT
ncbi:unnamed protein product [Ectocarpus sp. 8 AP-2014]